ncbi:rhamnose ABC transporter substrate-binding protein [Tropicimonas sp. IMCC34043]|uniref:rhamnose ABC transporter substrate-binding protein n=1 Tax=Tropicimonas sp. IMCC34043 TaxID=2248760 RepID=UPI000E269A3D|nr:rhamnose ABC transporter substrate-binding protein [Tropicimonas sp. IMCC34043]
MKLKTLLPLALAGAMVAGAAAADDVRIAMVPKSLGNAFFEAARDGGMEAAKEIGGVEIIFNAPAVVTAEGQIEVINALIAQRVDAIVVSSNDPDALVPISKKAMQRGIKVMSFDSAIAPDGRMLHLHPATAPGAAKSMLEMTVDAIGPEGEIAIVSETPQSTNQNEWIAEMEKLLATEEFSGLKLVQTAYGMGQSDKSYRETIALLRRYPDLKAIIAPSTVAISAAAKAVEDQGMVGKVYVTGLGLPSELAGYVHNGSVKSFAIWNPIDLGYAATYLAYDLIQNDGAKAGDTLDAGRMGSFTLDDKLETSLPQPFIYDATNVDEFAEIF